MPFIIKLTGSNEEKFPSENRQHLKFSVNHSQSRKIVMPLLFDAAGDKNTYEPSEAHGEVSREYGA